MANLKRENIEETKGRIILSDTVSISKKLRRKLQAEVDLIVGTKRKKEPLLINGDLRGNGLM